MRNLLNVSSSIHFMEYKQAIVIRTDLKMSKGKTAAQAAHASIDASLKVDKRIFTAWKNEGAKKVVLKVRTEKELIALKTKAERAGLKAAMIRDAGLTEIKPGSKTALAIGPDKEDKINKITGDLKIL